MCLSFCKVFTTSKPIEIKFGMEINEDPSSDIDYFILKINPKGKLGDKKLYPQVNLCG